MKHKLAPISMEEHPATPLIYKIKQKLSRLFRLCPEHEKEIDSCLQLCDMVFNSIRDANCLSEGEQQIMIRVVNGDSNRDIAEALHLAEKTVKFHLTNIFKKMHVNSRSKLIAKYYQMEVLKSEMTSWRL